MILKNAVSIYPEGRKNIKWPFSQFSNFVDIAVSLCTAEQYIAYITLLVFIYAKPVQAYMRGW